MALGTHSAQPVPAPVCRAPVCRGSLAIRAQPGSGSHTLGREQPRRSPSSPAGAGQEAGALHSPATLHLGVLCRPPSSRGGQLPQVLPRLSPQGRGGLSVAHGRGRRSRRAPGRRCDPEEQSGSAAWTQRRQRGSGRARASQSHTELHCWDRAAGAVWGCLVGQRPLRVKETPSPRPSPRFPVSHMGGAHPMPTRRGRGQSHSSTAASEPCPAAPCALPAPGTVLCPAGTPVPRHRAGRHCGHCGLAGAAPCLV